MQRQREVNKNYYSDNKTSGDCNCETTTVLYVTTLLREPCRTECTAGSGVSTRSDEFIFTLSVPLSNVLSRVKCCSQRPICATASSAPPSVGAKQYQSIDRRLSRMTYPRSFRVSFAVTRSLTGGQTTRAVWGESACLERSLSWLVFLCCLWLL